MNFVAQVAHVARKDVRRYRIGLLGLAALVGTHVIVGLPLPSRWVFGFAAPIQLLPTVFALFAAVVIQADPVVSDRAFLSTRPVAPGAVLTAKLLFLAVFLCAAPALVHVAWIERLGGDGPTLGLFADSVLYQGALLVVVALCAAMARSLTGCLVLIVAVWVGWAFVDPVSRSPYDRLEEWPLLAPVMETLIRQVTLAVGVMLLVYLYHSRRTARTGALAVASAVLLAGFIPHVVPLLPRPWEPAARLLYEQADDMVFEVRAVTRSARAGPLDADQTVSAYIEAVAGPGTVLAVASSETTLIRGDDRMSHRGRSRGPWFPHPLAVGGLTLVGFGAFQGTRPTPVNLELVSGSPSDVDRARADRLETTFTVDVSTRRIVGSLPFEEGASLWHPEVGTVTVVMVAREPGAVSVALVRRFAARATRSPDERDLLVLARNQIRGEVMAFRSLGGGARWERLAPEHYLTGGAYLAEVPVETTFSIEGLRGDALLDPGWFDDADLVVSLPHYEGSFTRTLSRDLPAWPEVGETITIDERRR